MNASTGSAPQLVDCPKSPFSGESANAATNSWKASSARSESRVAANPRPGGGMLASSVPRPLELPEPQGPHVTQSNLGLWVGRSELQQIADGLYITNYFGAKRLDNMVKTKISHVVVCAAELERVFEKTSRIKYLKLDFADNTNVSLAPIVAMALPWMRDAIESGGRVLVHCAAGASRSGAIAIAYLMAMQRLTFANALLRAQKIRPVIQPNQNFCDQLSEMDCGKVFQSPLSLPGM